MTSNLFKADEDAPMPWTPRGGLSRVSVAARLADISPEQFAAGCKSGDIPIALIRIGRFSYVRSEELNAWLSPRTQPVGRCEVDLF